MTARELQVLVFGPLRDLFGATSVTVLLTPGMTGEDLVTTLCERYPLLEAQRGSLRLAVNRRYVNEETALGSQDEVALVPPVSGG